MKPEESKTHPSYGLVQFNRTSNGGRTKLFGSAIKSHANTVRLSVSDNVQHIKGEFGDRYYASGAAIVEVELSAAQFAELITTMNIGQGVPCTIRRLGFKSIEEPPDETSEADRMHGQFKAKMRAAGREFRDYVEGLPAKMEAMKIPAKHREAIMAPVARMLQEIESNAPFWLQMFEESSEKIVTTAKSEIEAFIISGIHAAGMKAIQGAEVTPPQIEA